MTTEELRANPGAMSAVREYAAAAGTDESAVLSALVNVLNHPIWSGDNFNSSDAERIVEIMGDMAGFSDTAKGNDR